MQVALLPCSGLLEDELLQVGLHRTRGHWAIVRLTDLAKQGLVGKHGVPPVLPVPVHGVLVKIEPVGGGKVHGLRAVEVRS